MCLFPRLIKNPKYKPNKKNKGIVPEMEDPRVMYVPIKCGMCFECMRKKANEWRLRLSEDIKHYEEKKFITLTFSNESYTALAKEINAEGYLLDNQIAALAVRRFLERWRKKYKKSVRHWLITELGSGETEHLHLHGVIYSNNMDEIERIWKYGFIYRGKRTATGYENYVSEKTINYLMKYVTKADPLHKYYKPKIFCSAGIGNQYKDSVRSRKNKFNEKETNTTYTTQKGFEYAMPIYWRNQIYSEKEREKLWLNKLDENIRYVGGEPVNANDEDSYHKLLKFYRERNREMGYGSPDNWDSIEYERARRKLMQQKRMQKKGKND